MSKSMVYRLVVFRADWLRA